MTTGTRAGQAAADRPQSVRRALAMLEALAARPAGATPKELSQALRLHLSTSYRLLNTLVAGGYAIRSPHDGLFRLGSRVSYLQQGYLASLQHPPAALPFLHALQLATGETTMLTNLEGDNVAVTAIVEGRRRGAMPAVHIGTAYPAHAAAAGRVLLARLSPVRLDAYIARQTTRLDVPFPLTDPAMLLAELDRIRRDGYALDHGDEHLDFCCVATALACQGQEAIASLSLMAPGIRFRQEEAALIANMLTVTRAIESLHANATMPNGRVASAQPDTDETSRAAIEAAIASVEAAMSRVP